MSYLVRSWISPALLRYLHHNRYGRNFCGPLHLLTGLLGPEWGFRLCWRQWGWIRIHGEGVFQDRTLARLAWWYQKKAYVSHLNLGTPQS